MDPFFIYPDVINRARCICKKSTRKTNFQPSTHSGKENHPFGIFATSIQSAQHPLIQASHIPWVLDEASDSSVTELGVLRGHMAGQGAQSKALIEAATAANPERSKVVGGVCGSMTRYSSFSVGPCTTTSRLSPTS